MRQVLAIAAGGALGSLLRYWVSSGTHAVLGRGFPYGTLTVNVLGSLLMGFLYIWLLDRVVAGPVLRAFLLIGVLGGFTTFSSFSIESLNLIEAGQVMKALANILLSVTVCIVAAGLGVLIARQL
jgi:CrcB protein